MNIREIIKEAVTRVNLVPRRQAVPGDLVETAFKHLKGIVSKYNNDNLLSFTQNCFVTKNSLLTHIYDETDFCKGDNNMFFKTESALNGYELTQADFDNDVMAMIYGHPNTLYTVIHPANNIYRWVAMPVDPEPTQRVQMMMQYAMMNHVQIKNVAKINSIYITNPANGLPINFELNFVTRAQFQQYTNDSRVFTAVPKSQGEFVVSIKPIIANYANWKMTINYNEGIDFDLDSDLYIPDNYTELLILALAHKLAIQFPRLDDAQMQRLEREVQVQVDNVRTPRAMTKFLARESDCYDSHRLTQEELAGGTWLP